MAARALDIASPDGAIDATLFTPDTGEGRRPAIILFTDIGGLRPVHATLCQRIADAGYAVLLPNVYYRDVRGGVVAPGEDWRDPAARERMFAFAKRLTPAALARDFAALLDALDAAPEADARRIGLTGYCMSGALVLRFAAQHPDRIAAAAAFHSARLADEADPDSVHRVLGAIRARVYLGHADRDDHLPPEQIATVDRLLAAAHVHFTTELYAGALHGFAIADAPSYDAAASALHLRRLLALFDETLAG